MEIEISLKSVYECLKRGIWIIITAAVVFGAASFAWTKYMVEPTYQSKVKLAANSMDTDSQLINYYITIAPQYIEFLNVSEFYQMVADEVLAEHNKLYTAKEVGSMVSFSAVVENTGVFFVTVSGHDPQEVFNLASAIAKCAPDMIKNQKSSDVLSVISQPILPTSPTSPSISKNTAIAAFFGAALAAGIIIAIDLLDTRLKSSDEMTELYGLSVLGVVPDFSETGSAISKAKNSKKKEAEKKKDSEKNKEEK